MFKPLMVLLLFVFSLNAFAVNTGTPGWNGLTASFLWFNFLNQVNSPAPNPLSGNSFLYFKTDGQLYSKNSVGIETEIAGATTSAGVHFSVQTNNGAGGLAGDGNFLYNGSLLTLNGNSLINNVTAGNVILTLKGAASQSGHILDLKNSSNTVLTFFSSAGDLTIPNVKINSLLTLPVQGTGVTPTCGAPQDGSLALTHLYVLCVCNGSGWTKVSDGSTGCTF